MDTERQEPLIALAPYDRPTLIELGDVTAFTLGSFSQGTADKDKAAYY